MGTLAIGISLIMAIYALFLHITFRYLFVDGNSRRSSPKGFVKKLKEFLRSMGPVKQLRKQ